MGHVFVDVSNVAGLRKDEPDHAPWSDVLRVCDAWFQRHPDDSMTLVVDWGFHGYLQYNFQAEFTGFVRSRDAKQVRLPQTRRVAALIEAPEGVPADEFLLKRANQRPERQIIAEDRYRPYRDDYPWLQGFELMRPVFEGSGVGFEPIFLHPLDDDDIDAAEEADEQQQLALQERRDSRRNRHQRRQAARRSPATTRGAVSARPNTSQGPAAASRAASQAPVGGSRLVGEQKQGVGLSYWLFVGGLVVLGVAVAVLKFG